MNQRALEFEWDETKAAANLRKHAVSFELASTVFNDPQILTIPDLEHSEHEDRWFSVGIAGNGAMLAVAYLWLEPDTETTTIRLISARNATRTEMRHYGESL